VHPPSSPLRPRLTVLSILVVVLFVALSSRLWYLQVLAGERYGDLAEGNRVRQVVVEAPRGRILDAKGRVVVRNRAAWAVTVKPTELGDRRHEVLGRLARVLGTTRAKLEARIADYTGSPLRGVPVAEDVPTRQLFYLTEHADRFPGVAPEVLALREYPAGTAAAHVLGYVGEISADELKQRRFRGYDAGDIVGKAGVELTYDQWLRGRDGVQDLEVNAAGEVVRALGGRAPVPGRDLQLNLDLNLQVSVERALADGMRAARQLPDSQRGGTYPAPAATAVVLDPDDGAVAALASLPQYDPRRFVGGISRRDFAGYANSPGKPLLHRAVQSAYPPGSTWKPFTALAGLKAGTITPTSTYHCPGSFTIGSYTKRDWTPRGHGTVALTDSLRLSCDVYYYNLGAQLGLGERAQEERGDKVDEKMQATARQFGFGRQPAIDLPYGAEGTVPTREWRRRFWEQNKKTYCAGSSALYRELCRDGWRWQGGDNLNIAIGQGDLQVSPLQLALGYGAIANGGTVYRPHVGRAVLDPASGRVVRRVEPRVAEVADVPGGALAAVGQALASVPTGGTAASAFAGFPLDRFPVAGKTGTADLPPRAPFAWFASYAPVGDPKYVVVVMVEQGGHGGESAAPVARAIYQKLFDLPVTPVAPGADRSG
jgi:penicillin-binding protein 2